MIAMGRAASLIAVGARLTRLATGFSFTEGPVWDARNQRLIFSDIPASTLYAWSERGVEVLRSPSNRANGNAIDSAGRLITCEHDTSRVIRTSTDGVVEVLADSWDGSPLNSPNDVAIHRSGAIYFTDPDYGRTVKPFGGVRPVTQDARGVYRIDPEGGIARVIKDMRQPNGLCFTTDGSRLFVNDTQLGHVRRFTVMPDGSLEDGRVWVEVPSSAVAAPDGMKLDSIGNLYCTGVGGIHVFDPLGRSIGLIAVEENVGNFAFGGPGGHTLFVCASRSLYALDVVVPG